MLSACAAFVAVGGVLALNFEDSTRAWREAIADGTIVGTFLIDEPHDAGVWRAQEPFSWFAAEFAARYSGYQGA